MMKLDYVPKDRYSAVPFIRLYEFIPEDVKHLHSLFLSMASGMHPEIALHACPWITAMGNCRLFLLYHPKRDRGIIATGDPKTFECVYTDEGWLELAGKTEPFLDGWPPNSLTDLTMEGDLPFILTPDGRP